MENNLESAVRRRDMLNEQDVASYLREKLGKMVEIVKMIELTILYQIFFMFRT